MTESRNLVREYLQTTAAVLLAFSAACALYRFLPLPNLSLVFLMPVVFAGVQHGLRPSLFAAFLDFGIYNFFFTEPYYTFHVHAPGDLATLVFYLVVAIAVGSLTVRLKDHMARLEETRILSETEKLRSALLSSLSHDLRTPLASIIGSATSLQELGDDLSVHARRELLDNVLEEAERLNRFIQNLLDMTKLGHGGLRPLREWIEARDLIGGALRRVEKARGREKVRIDADPGLEMLRVDPVLMEQVLVNLLDNAVRHSPPGGLITVSLKRNSGQVSLAVSDEGSGIPEPDRERVFDMFYRVRSGDSRGAGTGLGLSICRGLVEAHGGRIHIESGPGGKGAAVVMIFPEEIAQTAAQDKKDFTHG